MGAINALVISSQDIQKDDFVKFFEALNCFWYSGRKDQAIIYDEYSQVGVCLMEPSYIEMFDEVDVSEYTLALGKEPRTFFEINRTKETDPNELYLKVAHQMSQVWPIVVIDINENILKREDIESRVGSS